MVFLLLFAGWGLAVHHWVPFAIFLGLTVALKALLGILVYKSHRTLRSGRVSYRIDGNGISMVLLAEDRYVRYDTDPWEAVERVYLYDDFCAIKMRKEAKLSSELYLFAKDMAAARQAVLGYWQRSANGTVEVQPDVYSPREREGAMQGIERTLGAIAMVRSPREAHGLQVEFALIPPTPESPCCKICTLGLGALLAKNVEDEVRWSGDAAESVELMMHLPASWNLLGEGWDEGESEWPFRLLLMLADDVACDGSRPIVGEWTWVDHRNEMARRVPAVMFDEASWQDSGNHFNLSTGRAVDFVQVIPITEEEINVVNDADSYASATDELFGIDVEQFEAMEPEEGYRIYTEAIVKHFERWFGRQTGGAS